MRKIALLLLAAPLVLAACGGGAPTAHVNVDPLAYVKHAAKKTSQTSEHMTLTATMDMGLMSLSMNGSGDFSFTQHAGSFALDAQIFGQDMKVQEVFAGTNIYMSSPVFASSLPAGKTWMKLDLAKLGKASGVDMSSMLSQNPSQSLMQLEAAGKVSEVGTETIDGAATHRYRVTKLDISKLLKGASLASLGNLKYGPIDVWIGDENGYVYRETMSFTASPKGQSMKMSMTANFSNFGESVHVTIPSASQTADASNMVPGFG